MQVTIRRFYFDSAKDPGYQAIRAEAAARGIHIMDATGDIAELPAHGAVFTVTDSVKGIHNNQFATAEGVRIFDCRILSEWWNGKRMARRVGYILEPGPGWDDLQALRAATGACGYCGARHVLSEFDGAGPHFCDRCAGSEYLTPDLLKLLQIRPLTEAKPDRTAAPPEWLQVEYARKQRESAIARAAAAKAAKLEALEKKRADLDLEARLIENLTEYGLAWRHIENLIYYSHTGRFCFGWRNPLTLADYNEINDAVFGANCRAFNIDYKTEAGV